MAKVIKVKDVSSMSVEDVLGMIFNVDTKEHNCAECDEEGCGNRNKEYAKKASPTTGDMAVITKCIDSAGRATLGQNEVFLSNLKQGKPTKFTATSFTIADADAYLTEINQMLSVIRIEFGKVYFILTDAGKGYVDSLGGLCLAYIQGIEKVIIQLQAHEKQQASVSIKELARIGKCINRIVDTQTFTDQATKDMLLRLKEGLPTKYAKKHPADLAGYRMFLQQSYLESRNAVHRLRYELSGRKFSEQGADYVMNLLEMAETYSDSIHEILTEPNLDPVDDGIKARNEVAFINSKIDVIMSNHQFRFISNKQLLLHLQRNEAYLLPAAYAVDVPTYKGYLSDVHKEFSVIFDALRGHLVNENFTPSCNAYVAKLMVMAENYGKSIELAADAVNSRHSSNIPKDQPEAAADRLDIQAPKGEFADIYAKAEVTKEHAEIVERFDKEHLVASLKAGYNGIASGLNEIRVQHLGNAGFCDELLNTIAATIELHSPDDAIQMYGVNEYDEFVALFNRIKPVLTCGEYSQPALSIFQEAYRKAEARLGKLTASKKEAELAKTIDACTEAELLKVLAHIERRRNKK